jgi:hypothetical protein
MWKLVFLAVALCLSVTPLDAAEGRRTPQTDRGDLRRDVERISKEIYRPRSEAASPGRSFAAGTAAKKR